MYQQKRRERHCILTYLQNRVRSLLTRQEPLHRPPGTYLALIWLRKPGLSENEKVATVGQKWPEVATVGQKWLMHLLRGPLHLSPGDTILIVLSTPASNPEQIHLTI